MPILSFKEILITLLKNDTRLVDEQGDLRENLVHEYANELDPQLIELLLDDSQTRERFFLKIKDVYVFKQNDFRFFLDENKLDNSYTQFENKIGLSFGSRLLRETSDVVLNFPYKDCILEGGQSTEEGSDVYFEFDVKEGDYVEKKAKRKEVFFNQILARDEIDRLLEPKAFTNIKRFTKDGEEKPSGFTRDENGTINDNLIIKGNNLLALHSLKQEFRGKVKLIYIDPPYNTGSDSFAYNDDFNHSTWLTFMKNRLEVARELLREDGVIFVQCDDNEQAYLKVLMDDVFEKRFVNCVTVKMSEASGKKMAHISIKLPKIKEYILIYKKEKIKFNSVKISKNEWDSEYNIFLENFTKEEKNKINEITDRNERKESDIELIDNILCKVSTSNLSAKIKELDIKSELDILNWKFENSYRIVRTAASSSVKSLADKKKCTNSSLFFSVLSSRDKIPYIIKSDYSDGSTSPRVQVLFAEDYLETNICDLWTDFNTTGLEAEGGVELKSGKKPEQLLKRVIELSTQKNDIILDFHLGSGTTASVAHKLDRQYIGIEQINYIENITLKRIQKVIDGEQGGISKSVNWQGGGSFIYLELAKNNQNAIEQIEKAESLDALNEFFEEMCEKYFLHYNVKIKVFREKISKEGAFIKLPLTRQKEIYVKMLDLNHLYVNVSDMQDSRYHLSKEDISLTNDFYNNEL